jgi:MFS family permease
MMDKPDHPSPPPSGITPAPLPEALSGPWWRELNRYHWFVFLVAVLGWMFDCLDQQLFILSRQSAMSDLLPVGFNPDAFAAYATAIFLVGWASGGLFFGVLGDRIGRAKTLMMTILVYSLCTGLNALSVTFWDFALWRFLTGLGVGGEFAVGATLVAEVMPQRARSQALASLQALSAVGNISAAMVGMAMGGLVTAEIIPSVWRPMFLVGAIPALLALLIRRRLREPERWQQVSHEGAVALKLGSYGALFGHPTWRKHALLGLALAFSGVVGLWAVGFFTIDLVGNIMEARFTREVTDRFVQEGKLDEATAATVVDITAREGFQAATTSEKIPTQVRDTVVKVTIGSEVKGEVAYWRSITSLMINLGAFIGMYSFGLITQRIGRRPTFAIAFVAAAGSTAAVLLFLKDFSQIYWMVPLMGICQLSLFAGYAIYFPELFPTHLRSTGVSFCYNVGRFVAAIGPFFLGGLVALYEGDRVERLRYAGLTMCIVFFVGLCALPWAPETKDHPLPE